MVVNRSISAVRSSRRHARIWNLIGQSQPRAVDPSDVAETNELRAPAPLDDGFSNEIDSPLYARRDATCLTSTHVAQAFAVRLRRQARTTQERRPIRSVTRILSTTPQRRLQRGRDLRPSKDKLIRRYTSHSMDSPTVVLVGERNPTHRSHLAFDDVMARLPFGVVADWLPTNEAARIPDSALGDLDGIWMASGSPYRNVDGALRAIRFAREQGVPLLGTCGGFQHVVLEFMRNVAGVADAAHAELDPDELGAVIVPLACSLLGQRRWVQAVPGTRAAAICGLQPMDGYHFCGYGVASSSIARLESAGLVISGHADDAGVEIVELPTHPFYMASAFQPQVGTEGDPETGVLHPLILAFAEAVSQFHRGRSAHH